MLKITFTEMNILDHRPRTSPSRFQFENMEDHFLCCLKRIEADREIIRGPII